jgi:poly-gamma-glutamate capsule biosynthesis protein CapA/YwtB (metallophosphatase superfamily)
MNKITILTAMLLVLFFGFSFQDGDVETKDVVDFAIDAALDDFEDFDEEVAEADEAEADNDDLEILAFGDVMLGRYVRTLMDENGKDYIFENLGNVPDLYPEADLVFANLEGPISGSGRSGGTAMIFSFNEDVAPFLKEEGFDLVTIANNHATDMGWSGRATTMTALKDAGVGFCGHPSEADLESVFYGKAGSSTYAFVCFNDIKYNLPQEEAVTLIKSVSNMVDYTVVSIHWGHEYEVRPDKNLQVGPAHEFIDAGADLIIGHHPHVVQGFEVYNDRFIFYSLGNFVFDQYWAQMVQWELGIGVSLSGDKDDLETTVKLFPMKSESSQVRLMNEEERTKWIEDFILYGTYSEEMADMIREGEVSL